MFAADKPIRHGEDDKYGREKYVDNLAYALLTGDDSDGLVVGIEGAWGSGKTSLKNMLIALFILSGTVPIHFCKKSGRFRAL